MKKETIVNDIKTAGVVVTATMTMSACNNIKDKPLNESEKVVALQKTDSIARQNPCYTLSQSVIDVCNNRIMVYQQRNKNIVKRGAKQHIHQQISDSKRRSLLMNIVNNESITGGFELDDNGYYMIDDNNADERVNAEFIRENYRWINDLLLYLNNTYTDRQLLKTEFFKVLNNKRMEKDFIANTEQIEALKTTLDTATKQGMTIYEEAWNKSVADIKKSRQR